MSRTSVGVLIAACVAGCGQPPTATGTRLVEWRHGAKLNDVRFQLGADVGASQTVRSQVEWPLTEGRGTARLVFEVEVGEIAVRNPTPIIPERLRGPRRITVTVTDASGARINGHCSDALGVASAGRGYGPDATAVCMFQEHQTGSGPMIEVHGDGSLASRTEGITVRGGPVPRPPPPPPG